MKCSVLPLIELDADCKEVRRAKIDVEGVVYRFDPNTGEIGVATADGVNYDFRIVSKRALNKCIKQKLRIGHRIKFKI